MNRKQRRASGSQGGSHQGTIADVAVFFNEALNYFRASQLREAESILNQILSSSPRHAESLHMLGVIEYQTGRAADAVKHMSQAVNLNNQQPSWHNNLGTVLNNLGKYKDAVAAYKSAIALKPDFHEAHTNLGDALKSLKKLDEAKASYESALALKPDYALALNGIGNILRDQAKPEEALTFYERAVTTAPGYAVAYYNMGTTFECMGKMDEAISYYKRGLEINPNNIETCVLLGRALQNRHQLHEAAELYQKALTLRENCIEAHFALGYIQHQLGNREAAIAHLNRCLEIDPQDQQFAGLLLAELTAKPLPEQAPDAFIQKIYAERALYWDRATAMEKSYQGHKLVADTLNRFYKDAQKLDILDAGCGTGLVGALIRGQARLLEGIDLSGEMLDKARAKGDYDALHQGDLVDFMNQNPCKYDVITSAATLIHFGDLKPVLQAAAAALRDEGTLICTLFPDDNEKENGIAVDTATGLAKGGCYRHGRNYIRRVAGETGFSVEMLETAVHEYPQKDQPAMGLVVALRRNPGKSS